MLAPKICPVCDRQYDHRFDNAEVGSVEYFHKKAGEKCVVETGKEPVTARLDPPPDNLELEGIGDS